ncbi:peptidoglycan-binding protein [Rhizobium sp. TRM95111]|uniref:peptidoglycan-binding domain-containing protein n=1 Tax=Rhizobium alarense TaxID=2846851 RepID=UPI001F4236FA|nr:peptidoglycan-binding domain-containing protein [Rhizobium alarense]MCF3638620.1 peptidoglycan-binding protein [Rhizobium alarense]
MTPRVRKPPEKSRGPARGKPRQARPGIAIRAVIALATFAARHPAGIGGGAAFAVVFGFVAANALWYQPGGHPSPIMKTRLGQNSLGFSALKRPPEDMTTFVIEREGEAAAAVPSQLVRGIQTELARQGFFARETDGLLTDETVAAIRAFEERRGLAVTGEPSDRLLAALSADAVETAMVVPEERPFDAAETATSSRAVDPVAAAILEAEADPEVTAAVPPSLPSEMVMQIQKGLSNIAYGDVTVDGIAGQKTRNAIRHFEKHYRLPETGEPNEMVLGKLKEIGAL